MGPLWHLLLGLLLLGGFTKAKPSGGEEEVAKVEEKVELKLEEKEDISAELYKGFRLFRVLPSSQSGVQTLNSLTTIKGLDFWGGVISANLSSEVLVAPQVLEDFLSLLDSQGIDKELLIDDLQEAIDNENPPGKAEEEESLETRPGHKMTWTNYHTYDVIVGYLRFLESSNPGLVTVQVIGKSYEGRPIYLAKVSKGSTPKPAIWIDSTMHAREWITAATNTFMLNKLITESQSHPELLDKMDWYFLPVINPDGYEYTHKRRRLWRKNRSKHSSSPFGYLNCYGVDLNRNWDMKWMVVGASQDPCSDVYAGPRPFSEPETKAVSDFILQNRNNIKIYVSLHSYSQLLFVPWGHTKEPPADFNEIYRLGLKAQQALEKVHGTQYKVGSAAKLLYATGGASDDWAKGKAGVKYSFTYELRDKGRHGFILPANQIQPTGEETWASIKAMANELVSGNLQT